MPLVYFAQEKRVLGPVPWLGEENKDLKPKMKLLELKGHELELEQSDRSFLRYLWPLGGLWAPL